MDLINSIFKLETFSDSEFIGKENALVTGPRVNIDYMNVFMANIATTKELYGDDVQILFKGHPGQEDHEY